MHASIDRGFVSWSMSWGVDRYLPGSVQIAAHECRGEVCQARGRFTFFRVGNRLTIPFFAQLARQAGGEFGVVRLCYDDTTSGGRDCTR